MVEKKTLTFLIWGSIISIIALLLLNLGVGGAGMIPSSEKAYKLTCSGTISNPILRESRFETYNCQSKEIRFCGLSVAKPLSWFIPEDELGLKLISGDAPPASKGITCREASTCQFQISICGTRTIQYKLKLLEGDRIIDER